MKKVEIVEIGINLLPMYGDTAPKFHCFAFATKEAIVFIAPCPNSHEVLEIETTQHLHPIIQKSWHEMLKNIIRECK